MSSDSEDEEQMKMFMEAADTTLLNNALFQEKSEENANKIQNPEVVKKAIPKSQRYLLDDGATTGTDFNLPETMQNHMAKKLSSILKETYEFCEVSTERIVSSKKKFKTKSRVTLLKGDDHYVNSYEEFEYETKGPDKKPDIKRRCIDNDEITVIRDLKSIAVNGNDLLSGTEVKFWAAKKERKDKVFHYKQGSNGVLHAKEEVNEFTAIRRKNKWNESKIKQFKRK